MNEEKNITETNLRIFTQPTNNISICNSDILLDSHSYIC
jgi:hypothetical protein